MPPLELQAALTLCIEMHGIIILPACLFLRSPPAATHSILMEPLLSGMSLDTIGPCALGQVGLEGVVVARVGRGGISLVVLSVPPSQE